jgi:surface antigen
MKKFLSVLITLLFITNCAGQNNVSKQGAGTVIGGVAGGLLGSQFGKGSGQILGIGLGALAGGLVGNQVGGYMDEQDKMRMERNANSSLENAPSGQTSTWKNPDTGNYGTFTPVKTYQQQGQYCREFTQQITVGGKTQEGYGTACRQPDGTWQIVK